MEKFRQHIYNEHDVVCNQKYADIFPYSAHLGFVEAQGEKFMYLIEDDYVINEQNFKSHPVHNHDIIRMGLIAHDTIEDARMTYNDVLSVVNDNVGNYKAAVVVAGIVYCVTDEKGKNRKERKNIKYYDELKKNKLALFVKLSDLAANMLFSKLTGSTMYNKYKKEWPKFKETLYISDYKEFFDYIENI